MACFLYSSVLKHALACSKIGYDRTRQCFSAVIVALCAMSVLALGCIQVQKHPVYTKSQWFIHTLSDDTNLMYKPSLLRPNCIPTTSHVSHRSLIATSFLLLSSLPHQLHNQNQAVLHLKPPPLVAGHCYSSDHAQLMLPGLPAVVPRPPWHLPISESG